MTEDQKTYTIIGACFEVYNRMGCGFLESVYQQCLEIEFVHQRIPFVSQKGLKVIYRDQELNQKYFPDFVCYDEIIIEIKALSQLCMEHHAQLLNYLHVAELNIGLLVNLGHYPKLEYKRMVL